MLGSPQEQGQWDRALPGRVTWPKDHLRGVGSPKVRPIAEQQGQASGTKVHEAMGQVRRLNKLF